MADNPTHTWGDDRKLDRPTGETRTLRDSNGTRVGYVGILHAPEGCVSFCTDEQKRETRYETVHAGRLYRKFESIARPERGAKIIAGQWIREIAGTGESEAG